MALLALEDGRVFHGRACGAHGITCGEVVFNTGLMGYQEILTDPSYAGQIVCMTYPHIGNYGVNSEDVESARPWVSGFVVRELSQKFSNWRGQMDLDRYLKEHNIIGVCEVDTRALTRHIREKGAMRGCLSSFDGNPDDLIERARRAPTISEENWVYRVSCAEPYEWEEALIPSPPHPLSPLSLGGERARCPGSAWTVCRGGPRRAAGTTPPAAAAAGGGGGEHH
ncbi:MAG: carbamoyl-phosphate synthase domain-containing protein, partial [Candidatus Bipolaricaulia bacterium]